MEYTLGLDLGITSVGWALINQPTVEEANNASIKGHELIDFGVRIFEQANSAQGTRNKRGTRRNIRRKHWRKQQLKQAFIDFGLIDDKEFSIPGYLSYTTNNEVLSRPKLETVYHLRVKALKEQVSMRELFLALYHIVGRRGHFLLESIDFVNSTSGISVEMIKDKFYNILSALNIELTNPEFERNYLDILISKGTLEASTSRKLAKEGYLVDDQQDKCLTAVIKLLAGNKVKLTDIDESFTISSSSMNYFDLVKQDELPSLLQDIVDLHDMIQVSLILSSHDYISQIAIEKLNNIHNIYKLRKTDFDKYVEEAKKIQSKMRMGEQKFKDCHRFGRIDENTKNDLANRLRVVRNLEDKYPNGLYVKEAIDILRKQQEYYPSITNEFINIVAKIVAARIPYYVGPLSPNGKNAWLDKTGKFKYSYEYSKDSAINEDETIRKWKLAMISHCTYLPDEYALPKGSFLAETFAIVNELNILKAIDKNGNDYYLTIEDKQRIFNELFLRKANVTYQDVANLLDLESFGTRKGNKSKAFNAQYTLYFSVTKVLQHLMFNDILDIFAQDKRLLELEDVILNINLFDEEVSKAAYFKKCYPELSSKDIAGLARLKSNGFYSFSKKFILDTVMDREGNSLLDKLFASNVANVTNEQMTIITNACDTNGNPLNFEANKYLDLLKENNKLDIHLLMDDNKPFVPMSRAVIRSINETFKIINEIIKVYGAPKRIVFESAREFSVVDDTHEAPAKRFDTIKKQYEYLTSKYDKKSLVLSSLPEWEELEQFVHKNSKKIALYISQEGKDMISGETIDIYHLEDYEIDHILPRGFGDNSMDNLMLIHKLYNGKKGDRVPLEYIEDNAVRSSDNTSISSSSFINRVNKLRELDLISAKKQEQLLLKSSDEALGFINRNLVDTRYIIRELMAILSAYNTYNHYDTHLVSLKSAFTNVYRQAFNIKKNRNIGVQHHAYDAATIAIADHVISAYCPNYDKAPDYGWYKEFISRMNATSEELKDDRDAFEMIRYAFKKAYGYWMDDNDSIIRQIKVTTPLYSQKVLKKYTGQFFGDNPDSPSNVKKTSPLSILNVNNEKRAFSSVNCFAVDFYKYTNKRKEKQYIGIQIPYSIVRNGVIRKDKYISLIKDYYRCSELLDVDGNINEYLFKMRVYKNDLIFDKENKEIMSLIPGSIVKKLLETKQVYIFPYDEIYSRFYKFKKSVEEYFDIKCYLNKYGSRNYSDLDKSEVIEFIVKHLMNINDRSAREDKTVQALLSLTKKTEKFQEWLEYCAFADLAINRKLIDNNFIDRFRPDAKHINGDNMLYKLKMSPLGIRWSEDNNKGLVIEGPRCAKNHWTKIRKEKFTWSVINNEL